MDSLEARLSLLTMPAATSSNKGKHLLAPGTLGSSSLWCQLYAHLLVLVSSVKAKPDLEENVNWPLYLLVGQKYPNDLSEQTWPQCDEPLFPTNKSTTKSQPHTRLL